MDKTIRKRIIKAIENLTNTVKTNKASTTVDYTFFSGEHETFSRTHCILGHNANLINFAGMKYTNYAFQKL